MLKVIAISLSFRAFISANCYQSRDYERKFEKKNGTDKEKFYERRKGRGAGVEGAKERKTDE